MRSYWERQTWSEADVVIVGGGLVGIQTAMEVIKTRPHAHVMLLERGLMPTGASTRNAGFACIGSLSEVVADIDLLGAEAALDIVRRRHLGLQGLRATCQGQDIGYLHDGGHEIFLDDHPSLDRIEEVNELLQPITGTTTFQNRNDLVSAFGFGSRVRHLVHSPVEGTVDSGKLLGVLWSTAHHQGVQIRTGSTVTNLESEPSGEIVRVRSGSAEYQIRAGCVVIATNAWIPDLVDHHEAAQIQPARGQILVTAPLGSMPLKGSFHLDEGFVYFRPVEDRILLGGARNLAFEEERTTSHEVTDRIQGALETLLREVIAPYHSAIRIDYRWAGTMAFLPSKHPIVEYVKPNVIVAFGCNGMGVALSSEVAARAAALV